MPKLPQFSEEDRVRHGRDGSSHAETLHVLPTSQWTGHHGACFNDNCTPQDAETARQANLLPFGPVGRYMLRGVVSNYPAIQVTSSMTDMSVEGVVQAAGGLLWVPYMKRVKGVLTISLDFPLNLP